MFVDTHCHLEDEKLKSRLAEVVKDFKAVGVERVITVGCDYNTSLAGKVYSYNYPEVYYAAGVHPMDVKNAQKDELINIEKLLSDEKCVAVGEIGLDYYWEKDSAKIQAEYFVSQIELAKAYKLPVNLHIRDAMGDAVKILKDNKDKLIYGAVMHCYSGSVETAKELLPLGFYFSFGGTATFKNARSAPAVIEFLPIDRILTETDSPYLAPEPVRGTVNEPKNIPTILKKLAEIKNIDGKVMENAVMNNAKTLFYKL